jgi:hypothetical protein
MIEAINFFQSLFSLNNFAPAEEPVNRDEVKLVRALIKDAKTLAQEAESEARHGETARNVMREAAKTIDNELEQNMARIAVWHFERSLKKYQKASVRYHEAGRMQTKKSRVFFAEAGALAGQAGEIKIIIESLNNFLKQS